MTGLLAAEGLKLRTTRTPWVLLGVEIVLVVAAVSGSFVAGAASTGDLGSAQQARTLLAHGGLTALLTIISGVLLSAGEFRHGTAIDTFLTTPRRATSAGAQVIVGGGFGLIAGLANAAAVGATTATWYMAKNVHFSWGSAVWGSLAGVIAWHLLYAVLGVALGLLFRSPAAAIIAALAWFTIAETTVAELLVTVGRWLPGVAARALGNDPTAGLLAPAAGLAVLLGWVSAVAVAAVVALQRRDLA